MPSTRRAFLQQVQAAAMGAVAMRLEEGFGRVPPLQGIDWDGRVDSLLAEKSPDDIVLTAVGDMIFNREITGFEEPGYRNLYRIMREANIAFGNLEMSLNEQPDRQRGHYNFRRESEFAWEIAKIGINLVGLANNHALDYDQEGLADCLRILRTHGISAAGAGMDLASARAARGKTVQKTDFALLSYLSSGARSSSEGPTIATIQVPEVFLEYDDSVEAVKAPLKSDVEAMEDAISLAKRDADFVMVAYHFHWVQHSRAYPTPDTVPPHQRLVVHKALDAGADVVLGSGPHVLRGIELYKGKPIFYSLGNFIYQYKTDDIPPIVWQRDQQQDIPEEFETVVPRLTVTDKKIRKIELIPVTLDMEGPRYGCPTLASDQRGREIIQSIRDLSKPYQTEISSRDWYGVIETSGISTENA